MPEPQKSSTKSDDVQLPQEKAASVKPGLWRQLRRLLVFQLKLYIDAFRDILLSPLSAIAVLLDVLQNNDEQESHFSRVLRWGRRTERAINLFEQHDLHGQDRNTVDGLIRDVEDKLSR